MSKAGVGSSDDRFIFRSIVKTKRGERLREIGNMSYTRLRECFKEKLEFLGFAAQNYGLHSLRAGGLQLQPIMKWLTDYSKSMAAGGLRQLRMGT